MCRAGFFRLFFCWWGLVGRFLHRVRANKAGAVLVHACACSIYRLNHLWCEAYRDGDLAVPRRRLGHRGHRRRPVNVLQGAHSHVCAAIKAKLRGAVQCGLQRCRGKAHADPNECFIGSAQTLPSCPACGALWWGRHGGIPCHFYTQSEIIGPENAQST